MASLEEVRVYCVENTDLCFLVHMPFCKIKKKPRVVITYVDFFRRCKLAFIPSFFELSLKLVNDGSG